uniref:SERTA domain-containing protein n=1 Tax=Trichuris muris TaxID=70415 RepID=A0A5S6R575_TRIMR
MPNQRKREYFARRERTDIRLRWCKDEVFCEGGQLRVVGRTAIVGSLGRSPVPLCTPSAVVARRSFIGGSTCSGARGQTRTGAFPSHGADQQQADPIGNTAAAGFVSAVAKRRKMEYQDEMCEKLIELSFAKIVSSKNERGGACLRKNLLIFQLLQKARSEQQRMRQWNSQQMSHPTEACFVEEENDRSDMQEQYAVLDISESVLDWNHRSDYLPMRHDLYNDEEAMESSQLDFQTCYDIDDCQDNGYLPSEVTMSATQREWEVVCCNAAFERTQKRKSEPVDDPAEDWALQKRVCPLPPADSVGLEPPSNGIGQLFSLFGETTRSESVDGTGRTAGGRDLSCPSFLELICES